MSFGMTYDEFWYGTPQRCVTYRKLHDIKQDETNFYLWLQGFYNYTAVSTALSNAFKAKGKKADDYLKEPIRLRQKSKEELIAEQERKNQELIAKLNAKQQAWVKKHKGGTEDG